MTIRIPPKADIETQNAFRDVEERLKKLESPPQQRTFTNEDLDRIRVEVEGLKADPDKYEELRETTFVAPVNFEGDAGFTGNIYPGFLDVSTVGSSDQKTMNLHGSLAIAPGSLSADTVRARQFDAGGHIVFPSYGAQAILTADETIGTGSVTPIPWDGTNFDQTGFWSAGDPTKLTVTVPGLYLVTTSFRFDPFTATSTRCRTTIAVNGTAVANTLAQSEIVVANTTTAPAFSLSWMGNAAAGDYFVATALHFRGGNETIEYETANLSVYCLGPQLN